MISVVIPAHNERADLEATVTELVDELRSRGAFELVVVENGSTDGTLELAATLADKHQELRVLTSTAPDYGRALRTGILAAKGDYVVTFDADFYSMDFLDEAIALLQQTGGPVGVVGSKRAPGADDTRHLGRRAVTATFTTILRVGFGLRVSDTHGIKAYRREPIARVAEQCTFGTDLFDTELILRAERQGLPIGELPVRVEERRPARSSILRRIVRSVIGLVRLRIHLGR